MPGKRRRKKSRSPNPASRGKQKEAKMLAHKLAHSKNIPQRQVVSATSKSMNHKGHEVTQRPEISFVHLRVLGGQIRAAASNRFDRPYTSA